MNNLAQFLQRGEGGVALRQGVVSAVGSGVATVVIGVTGIQARYLKPAPTVGDTVLVTYLGSTPVVLGSFAAKSTNLVDGEGDNNA